MVFSPPFHNCNIPINISIKHRKNDISREGTEVLGGGELTQCHFVQEEYQMGWPAIETGPPL